jgi:hypothetical protein
MSEVLRIANCSGFYGDRIAAAREMVEGGPIDVLTGDYLAELTMLILFKAKAKDPTLGYARTFLQQFEEIAATCAERGTRIVVNAGGLNPAGCADAVREIARKQGLDFNVAYIDGDDLLPELAALEAQGETLEHMEKGIPLGSLDAPILSANAYLGGWGIAEALSRGADIVICPRVTDAALALGPAAWKFGWARDDWDRLAAGVVAGHILECGTQCTGGNYAFFREVPGLDHPGFPIAEMGEDGSFVVTKHPGTGGVVSVGTVTAQLLYEIDSPNYRNPDVTACFDTIELEQQAPDRVRVSGIRGVPPPPTTKVCINYLGGYRNSMTFLLTGLDIEEKARLAEETLWKLVGGRDQFAETSVRLTNTVPADPASNDEAFAHLVIGVKDPDPAKVGRAFSSKVVEMALASYPGFAMTSPPSGQQQFGVYWPALVSNSFVKQRVHVADDIVEVLSVTPASEADRPGARLPVAPVTATTSASGETALRPLGDLCGARSGDKGGNANLGVWARSAEAYAWLENYLSVERVQELLPETRDLEVLRYELPNLLAMNFVVKGLLGDGVSASMRSDPQAKTLGEYLRSKRVEIPIAHI